MAKRKATPGARDSDKKILERMRERFRRAYDADKENRDSQLENTEFVYVTGKQWTPEERKFRKKAEDPCMEFPQLKQFVAQVVNDQRKNRPGIRVHPADGLAKKEVAEIVQGVIRGIEYDSRAEAVYDSGYQHSVVGGRGFWRIVSEFENPKSFNQKLLIKRIPDPSSVVLDPDFEEPDGGDRDFGFVFEDMDVETEFERRYPDAKKVDIDLLDEYWRPGEGRIRVADYYERVCENVKLVMLADGTSAYEDELPPDAMPAVDERGKVVQRDAERYRVDWYTVAGGDQILERHEWPGTIVPIVCAMGDEIVLKGKKLYQGLIEQAKDTQRLFNFGMTQQAISLALTPRAPYIGSAKAFAGYEAFWKTANTANHSFLPYNAYDPEGKPLPPPSRQAPATPDAGWITWTQQMQGLLKSIIGMYENTLGMRGQEVSGVAIRQRESQGDTATFHFLDNFSRAVALTGRIIVECIPTFYDTQRLVQIVGPDDVAKMQKINESVIGMGPGGMPQPMTDKDLRIGQYAVTVEAGPGYATKRQEAADLMIQLVQAFPQMMQFAGDIIVGMQDIPDVDLLVERWKLMLPPPVQQMLAAKDAGENPQVAQLNAQMQQMAQQFQQQAQAMQAQMQQIGMENQQLKADKSASIAASQARQRQAEASVATEQQRAANDAQSAQAKAENDRLQIIADRMTAQEERAIQRDKIFADLLSNLIKAAAQPQQVATEGASATQALEANP